MANKHTGVHTTEAGNIRIWFTWEGKKRFEPLNLPATAANLNAAAKFRARVAHEAKLGVLDYAATFPNSRHVKAEEEKSISVYDSALYWLKTIDHLSISTRKEYRRIANRYLLPFLGDQNIKTVITGDLQNILNNHEWKTGKRRNNVISCWRSMFEEAVNAGYIENNPAERLKFAKHQKPTPEPLTVEEMLIVLDWIKSHRKEWLCYFTLAFNTGARPSELIALEWGHIDFNTAIWQVSSAYVEQTTKGTKTHRERDIELNEIAMAALKRQKPATFLHSKLVLLNPQTNQQINSDKPPRLVWDQALKATGIRHRKAYSARHTFATLHLMAGTNPMYVAQQLGHTNMKMLLEHYGKWIPRADNGQNMNNLTSLINAANNKKI